MNRRKAVKLLTEQGYWHLRHGKHETFVNENGIKIQIPYHTEINELLWKSIKKQAGIT